MSTITVLRHERARVLIYDVKIKSMLKNVKKKEMRIMKKTCSVIHLELNIDEIT